MVRIGFRNLKKYPLKNIVIFLGFVILQTTLIMVGSYVGMLKKRLVQTEKSFSSASRLIFYGYEDAPEIEEYLKSLSEVTEVQTFCPDSVMHFNYDVEEDFSVKYSELELLVGDKIFYVDPLNDSYEISAGDFIRTIKYKDSSSIFSKNRNNMFFAFCSQHFYVLRRLYMSEGL